MAAKNPIIFLNITVENIEEKSQVFEILKHVKPGWMLADLVYNGFDTGCVNGTKVFYQRKDDKRDDAVIVRVFSDGLGDANPRESEFLAMQIAHAAGCFPTIHASFTNGVVYKYAKGRVLCHKDLVKPDVIADITHKVYHLNHIDLESLTLLNRHGGPAKLDGKTNVLSRIKRFVNNIPTELEDQDRNKRFQDFRQKFSDEMLLAEYEFVKQLYEDIQMPVVFSHGDLHPHNMVIDDESNEITFVDLELTGFSYGCWDLCYLLSMKPFYDAFGWTDESEPDISEVTRLMYIKGYLAAMFKQSGKEAGQMSDVYIEFMDLQFKLQELSVQCFFMIGGLGAAALPRVDTTLIILLANEKYTALKYSINDIKARYVELKQTLRHLDFSNKTGRMEFWLLDFVRTFDIVQDTSKLLKIDLRICYNLLVLHTCLLYSWPGSSFINFNM